MIYLYDLYGKGDKKTLILQSDSSDIFRLENLSVWQIPVLRLADKKLRIYWVWNIGKTVLVISKEYLDSNKLFYTNVLHIIYPYFSQEKFGWTLGFAKHMGFSILKMWPQASLQISVLLPLPIQIPRNILGYI
jgi:hypothetical protein